MGATPEASAGYEPTVDFLSCSLKLLHSSLWHGAQLVCVKHRRKVCRQVKHPGNVRVLCKEVCHLAAQMILLLPSSILTGSQRHKPVIAGRLLHVDCHDACAHHHHVAVQHEQAIVVGHLPAPQFQPVAREPAASQHACTLCNGAAHRH